MRVIFGLMVVVMLFVGATACSSRNKEGKESGSNDSIANKVEIVHANDMNEFNNLIKGDQPVLVDFYADWCAPCRMMSPILQQVASKMQGEVRVIKVDVDKNRKAAMKYGIQSIPALMLFQQGEIKWQGVGVMQADQIEQIVKSKTKIDS